MSALGLPTRTGTGALGPRDAPPLGPVSVPPSRPTGEPEVMAVVASVAAVTVGRGKGRLTHSGRVSFRADTQTDNGVGSVDDWGRREI